MKLRFLYILLVILGLSLNTDCLFSDDHEISSEISEESFNKNDDEIKECEEKPVSRLTQSIDKLVEWNQKYIIPLSYAYIGFDVSKNLYGMIKNKLQSVNSSEKIYPNYSGDNQLYQRLESQCLDVAKRMEVMPSSISVVNNPGYRAAVYNNDIMLSKSTFEEISSKEAEHIFAHELSHIKKGHNKILSNTGGLLTVIFFGSVGISLSDFDILKNNFGKFLKIFYTSPLLYYFCAKLIWYAVSRYCEKDADLTAAAVVGPDGAIEFFGKRLNGYKTGLFDSHPSFQERFDYHQAFKKDM